MRIFALLLLIGCAGTPAVVVTVPQAQNPNDRCEHKVAREVCVVCHPELVGRFKKTGDWCPEHDRPESQCLLCHPQLASLVPVPAGDVDVQTISKSGENIDLSAHIAPGKVTIFDFYADWCLPCRDIDRHVYEILKKRSDVAYRKINVVSWETAIAKRYLQKVPSLPYVVVWNKEGKQIAAISGLELKKLDDAIFAGGAR